MDDSYTFTKAEDFYGSLYRGEFNNPNKVTYEASDNVFDAKNPILRAGVVFRLEDQTLLLLQFIRPKVFKITFEAQYLTASEYHDFNSRTIITATTSELIDHLDYVEKVFWKIRFNEKPVDDSYYLLESVTYGSADDLKNDVNGTIVTELYIYKNPFKIQAVRSLESLGISDPPPRDPSVANVKPTTRKVVWQTEDAGLAWKVNGTAHATVLAVDKPGSARYLGFGEQGGSALLKENTLMNYFNYDNMMYSGVYNQGPTDEREPLYHSDPFWLEVNGLPDYKSQVATFVDNYSQICVDFSEHNSGTIRVGTRYGAFQYYVMAGDDVRDIIRLYTSLVGRSMLKPRYVLGHHQGCYGYERKDLVLGAANDYRTSGIPLDGIHVDVDLQEQYRTFTIDQGKFPDAKGMFSYLRGLGVKCSTNITPVINCTPSDTYTTLNEGRQNNYFVLDKRYSGDSVSIAAHEVRYIAYEGGYRQTIDPINQRPGFPGASDNYVFTENYNSGNPFRGGVSYGALLGAPGYYPNLNSLEVRKWWGKQYQFLFDQGLEFVWQDMTTPAIAKEYGDMKAFPFRLMLSSDGWSGDPNSPPEKPALEIWSLYSYNLHKATYKGLNRLPSRKGKRNFIIGRGSFAGMHRWAGLWTGDNASTWDFFRISVSQVLALGFSGAVIAGADVGGFMPNGDEKYADPELLIRWYCAYSLLPWFRNHYHGKKSENMKWFQEPYVYTKHFYEHQNELASLKDLYLSVEIICRYYVQLRYSLMQLLYDALFENQADGLPIARALIITDTLDTSLFIENAWALDNEYIVRQDLLVAPVMTRQVDAGGHRRIYLPQPDYWYPFNLRIDGSRGVPLSPKIEGGSKFDYDAVINSHPDHLPYITPMFIRAGGIIPQIGVRQFVHDPTNGDAAPPNPITIHVYPGKNNKYQMYLDDGVSRESAPSNATKDNTTSGKNCYLDLDPDAGNVYREITINQVWAPSKTDQWSGARTLNIKTTHDGYKLENVKRDIGDTFTIILWHDPDINMNKVTTKVDGTTAGVVTNLSDLVATEVKIPVEASDVSITVNYVYES
ncbi:hypothetical protein RUND412_000778 [Rhizina undulata]